MKTLRALAALLSYPSTDLIEAADEIRQAIDGDARCLR
jgi:nitrate reductase assembly molybdenum cofactor insertion protein NarJ